MQDRQNGNRKKSGSGLIPVIILAAVYVFQWIADGAGRGGLATVVSIFFLAIAVAVAAVCVALFKKKKESASPAKTSTSPTKLPAEPIFLRPNRSAKPNCDYGEVNHKYSHDVQRRIEQLDGFLKNGIITKEEYKVLLDRYIKSAGTEL